MLQSFYGKMLQMGVPQTYLRPMTFPKLLHWTCSFADTFRVGSKSGAGQTFPFSSYFCTAWNTVMWGLWESSMQEKISLIVHISFPMVIACTYGYSRLLSRNWFCTAVECPNVISNSECLWSSLGWSGLAKGNGNLTVKPRKFMTKLVQALLSIIDRERMEKATCKNGKMNILIFLNS